MSLKLSKVVGKDFQFKNVDYSSPKIKTELKNLSKQKGEIYNTMDFSIYDLQKITFPSYPIGI